MKRYSMVDGKPPGNQGIHDAKRVPRLRKWWQVKDTITLDIQEDIPDFEKEYPEFTGWESVGFQRGLGRELWQIEKPA